MTSRYRKELTKKLSNHMKQSNPSILRKLRCMRHQKDLHPKTRDTQRWEKCLNLAIMSNIQIKRVQILVLPVKSYLSYRINKMRSLTLLK